ncbi:hypothetical protein [Candidatus Poriferisodalis sp.]|uniref:hypothetical protein n=1 Tax=Candidatus Poriferisodalis sp. TaxID=3101277 RepID=UPI003B014769
MEQERADLYFGRTHAPCGFTSGVVAQFDGSAEPVVRELLQNSLDAAHQAGRAAQVRFRITDVPRRMIPGWEAYEHAFERALEARYQWHGGSPSHDEKMVIERIESARSEVEIPLLLCVDNGVGLDGHRMDALLTPGNTSKGEQGAGSFGLGHHAAFGASNLRYVLYAAKYRGDSDERLRTISSGHTILASHRDSDESGHELAADGYWFRLGQGEMAFDGSHTSYPRNPPDLLAQHLDEVVDTGTVVCIVGFNDFYRDDDDPTAAESICRVAAANFSDAVHAGRLHVIVEDEQLGSVAEVTAETLGAILGPTAGQRRAPKQGQINGSRAHAAWQTVDAGSRINVADGTLVRWRSIEDEERSSTQVHVFRKGMWITSNAPGLNASDFSNVYAFDAVLSLDTGPLEDLVRSAEGPEHRGIDRRRLSNAEKAKLRELVSGVADRLRQAVGKRRDLTEFTPPGFATIEGHQVRAAETVKRPRLPAGGGSGESDVSRGEKKTGGSKASPRRAGQPQRGTTPRYRSSLRDGGQADVLEALIAYDEEVTVGSTIGVRIRVASGSDGTCDNPLPDSWLRLRRIVDESGNSSRASSSAGDFELTLPAVSGERLLTIRLADAASQPGLLEVDIVKRIPPKERPQADGEADPGDSDGTASTADGLVADASGLAHPVASQADSVVTHTSTTGTSR